MAEYIYTTSVIIRPTGPNVGTAVAKSATANAYGSWVEMVSSTSAIWYMIGAKIYCANANTYIQLSIGTGASGSETEICVLNFPPITTNFTGFYIPIFPPVRIASGTRIAARTAGSTTAANTINVVLHFAPFSGIVNPILEEVESPDGTVVSDASNTASSFKTNLTQSANDYWKDCFLKFKTGSLAGQVRKVTGYNGSTKFITCDPFTSTPAANDTFDLINR